ncbi:hypothetical protein [Candidatus Villigracilis affinis]|uniref:hypothetical protein n=1 Tax=Candidatus Villigracilis affinis TaxID=3140682 RepID=UPI001E14ED36|nr:hypothetical protein [Anaerolineales bacterium]
MAFSDAFGHLDNGARSCLRGTAEELSPWSPDSKYIAYNPYYLAGIDGPHIRIGGYFLKWVDANHFFYANVKDENITTLMGEIIGGKILTYSFDPSTFIKPK